MTYDECLEKSYKISDITGGILEKHIEMPGGYFAFFIRHPDKVLDVKDEPYFFSIVLKAPLWENIKILALDYKVNARAFWDKFKKDSTNRQKMISELKEPMKNILGLDEDDKDFKFRGEGKNKCGR